MIEASIPKNDKAAKRIIWILSLVVFLVVVSLKYIHVEANLGFDPHLFASINAFINGSVAILLATALIAVKQKNYSLHKRLMLLAMILSSLFLVSYIAHHVFTGDTAYPKDAPMRAFYFIVLITHIILAAVILPFILFTTYRGLTADFQSHKKIARITWPIWFYVAVSGVIVYWMISPYYA
jgi:putative membrane protein